jgi:hypothetical protein
MHLLFIIKEHTQQSPSVTGFQGAVTYTVSELSISTGHGSDQGNSRGPRNVQVADPNSGEVRYGNTRSLDKRWQELLAQGIMVVLENPLHHHLIFFYVFINKLS